MSNRTSLIIYATRCYYYSSHRHYWWQEKNGTCHIQASMQEPAETNLYILPIFQRGIVSPDTPEVNCSVLTPVDISDNLISEFILAILMTV